MEEELGLGVAADEMAGDAGELGFRELRGGDVQRPVDLGVEALRAVPEGFLDRLREGVVVKPHHQLRDTPGERDVPEDAGGRQYPAAGGEVVHRDVAELHAVQYAAGPAVAQGEIVHSQPELRVLVLGQGSALDGATDEIGAAQRAR
ncbi:hypothetical protein ACQ4WX_50185 [Streptomyces lasalocidi]